MPKLSDSIFRVNDAVLKTTPNLILDLRGNGGGGDASFQPIMPWIYSNPIIVDGNDVYATVDNISRWELLLDNPDLPEFVKMQLKIKIKIMKQSPETLCRLLRMTLLRHIKQRFIPAE